MAKSSFLKTPSTEKRNGKGNSRLKALFHHVELPLYIGLFIAGLCILYKWTSVPDRVFEIEAERIDTLYQQSKELPSVLSIEYNLPVTDNSRKEMNGRPCLTITAGKDFSGKLSNGRHSEATAKMDSLRLFYESHYPDSLEANPLPVYYIKAMQNNINAVGRYRSTDFEPKAIQPHYFAISSNYLKREGLSATSVQEAYFQLGSPAYVWDCHGPMDASPWWTMGDISKSHYHIRMKSQTIKKVNFRIGFRGVANMVDYSSDSVQSRTNNIAYDDMSMKKGGNYEASFYVEFPELQNIQEVRITILIAILLALLPAIIRKLKKEIINFLNS